MPPKAVVCSLCGGKFFKSSLAHHQKVCREKVGRQCHECPYCHGLWPMLEMDAHIMTCPAALSAGARPTGASAALAKRLSDHRNRLENGIPEIVEERALGGNCMGEIAEYEDQNDTRVPCQICGRKFAMERIGKHQAICEKIASKPRRRKVTTESTAPMPAPMKSNWRAKSEAFREAAKAARSYPMPTWGSGNSYSRARESYNGTGHRPAAGSALAAVRQKASPEKNLKVPTPQLGRSGATRRVSAPDAMLESCSNRSSAVSDARLNRSSRSSSTGAVRSNNISSSPLPQWGSGAPSRYGRECITSCPVRTTPHNTSWGGCAHVAAQEKSGFESNRCSFGNPLDRSWLHSSTEHRAKNFNPQKLSSLVQNPTHGVSAAPVLLGRCRSNETRHVHFA